jgi:AraC-like DNA-binding protein
MTLIFEERLSDSPFVERVWRTHPGSAGPFISIAVSHCEIVVTKHQGQTFLTVRGPETKATPAYCPEDAEHFGIIFKFGALIPHLPARNLVNGEINLPEATCASFWLKGSAWQIPNYENADTFIDRLVRQCLVVRDPVVEAALQDHPQTVSLRSVQRRFLQATGLTHSTVRQIERARHATTLLQQGVSILDTVEWAGYADQPHLTRSLKYFIGQTPAQLMPENSVEQLSFLFKTKPSP